MDLKRLVVLSFVFVLGPLAKGQTPEQVMEAARDYAKAVEKGKWEKIADMTYPQLLQEMGGRSEFVRQAQQFQVNLERREFAIEKAELAEPLEPIDSGGTFVVVVPMKLTFDGPLGKLYSESGLLAISTTEGEKWWFIDLAQVQLPELLKLFPHIAPHMELPTKRIYQE